MKPEPLKDKGNTVDEITDWVINLYDKQAEELRKQGVNATLDIDKVLKLKNKVYEVFKGKKIFDDEEILNAVEWLKEYLNEPVYYFTKFPNELKGFWKDIFEEPKVMILAETEIWKHSFNIWLLDKAFQDVVIKK